MPKFLIEASYTVQGVEGVRSEGGTDRRDAVADTVNSVGGKLESFYFGFGDHDAFVTVDLPDDEGAAAVALIVWYPVNDNPRDKATYDITVSVPRGTP